MPYSISLGFNSHNVSELWSIRQEAAKTLATVEAEKIPPHINVVENLTRDQGLEIIDEVGAGTWLDEEKEMQCNGLLTIHGEVTSLVLRWSHTRLTRALRECAQRHLGERPEPNDEKTGYAWMCKTTLVRTTDESIKIEGKHLRDRISSLSRIKIKDINLIEYSKRGLTNTAIKWRKEID